MPSGTVVKLQETAIAPVIDALKLRWSDRVSVVEAVRLHHANTLSWLPPQPPDAVFFAESAAEVQDVVKLCAAIGCR